MRIWQLHFTRNNHQQTGQRCHKENSSSLQLHSRAIRGKYSCRGAKSEPVISTARTQGRVKKCQQLNQHLIGEQKMTENYIVSLVAWIILYASFWLTKHNPRPSPILCKPPMWCRIEAPHRRFYISIAIVAFRYINFLDRAKVRIMHKTPVILPKIEHIFSRTFPHGLARSQYQ